MYQLYPWLLVIFISDVLVMFMPFLALYIPDVPAISMYFNHIHSRCNIYAHSV